MLASMTGYGCAQCADERWSVKVEIRSLNHRYADVVVRLPKGYASVEERIRRMALDLVGRGRVEIFVEIEEFGSRKRTVKLDRALLLGYLEALSDAENLLQRALPVSGDMLFKIPELFVVEESETDPETVWPLIERAIGDASAALHSMRLSEGARLEKDVRARIDSVKRLVQEIEMRAPDALTRLAKRLTDQVARLVGESVPVDEQRIAQEIAIFADKSNIDEEIARIHSHLEQFLDACSSGESVGRKLDFIVQELNREVNTISSKAQDGVIANLVVEAKAELEKIREQIQNVQ